MGAGRGTLRLNLRRRVGNHLGSDGVPRSQVLSHMDAIPDKSEMAPEACCQKCRKKGLKTQIREQGWDKDHLFREERMELFSFSIMYVHCFDKERARAVLDFLDSCVGSKRF